MKLAISDSIWKFSNDSHAHHLINANTYNDDDDAENQLEWRWPPALPSFMQPHINHARHPLKTNDRNVAGRKSDSHVIVNREVGAGKRGVSGKDEAGVNVHPKAAAGELQTRRRSDKSNKSDSSHHEPQQAICMSNATPDHHHKRSFKSLSPAESLPRNETLGGYIFVCNNDTMQEDLRRQLFGMPQRYRDSVRAIQPGLPLFLYNYTTHQLHGIYEAASFGGSNIDPTAWEDKKSHGVSRFPAQVRIRVRRLCKALEEDAFRPVLHHYDGPKFRLQLSVPETIPLLDLFNEGG